MLLEQRYSCGAVDSSFNVYRNNKVSVCCHSFDPELEICDISSIDDFQSDSLSIVNNILSNKQKIQNKLFSGIVPNSCKNCSHLVLLDKNAKSCKLAVPFKYITLNHYKICNLRCKHCGYLKVDDRNFDTSNKKVLLLLRSLHQLGYINSETVISIGGGEPSIAKDLDLIIDFCIEKKILLEINSNASKYSDLFCKGARLGLIKLVLTPDAGTRDVYLKIKGRDYFDRCWENIQRYVENSSNKVFVKFIIEEGNYFDVDNMIDKSLNSKVENLVLSFDLNIKRNDFFKYKNAVDKFVYLAKKNNFYLETMNIPNGWVSQLHNHDINILELNKNIDFLLSDLLNLDISNIYLYCFNNISMYVSCKLLKKGTVNVLGIFDKNLDIDNSDLPIPIIGFSIDLVKNDKSAIIICSDRYFTEIKQEILSKYNQANMKAPLLLNFSHREYVQISK